MGRIKVATDFRAETGGAFPVFTRCAGRRNQIEIEFHSSGPRFEEVSYLPMEH